MDIYSSSFIGLSLSGFPPDGLCLDNLLYELRTSIVQQFQGCRLVDFLGQFYVAISQGST